MPQQDDRGGAGAEQHVPVRQKPVSETSKDESCYHTMNYSFFIFNTARSTTTVQSGGDKNKNRYSTGSGSVYEQSLEVGRVFCAAEGWSQANSALISAGLRRALAFVVAVSS